MPSNYLASQEKIGDCTKRPVSTRFYQRLERARVDCPRFFRGFQTACFANGAQRRQFLCRRKVPVPVFLCRMSGFQLGSMCQVKQ